MTGYVLEEPATAENFEEDAYLAANPDVAEAVERKVFASGREHFSRFGHGEGRILRRPLAAFTDIKAEKLRRIAPLLREDMPHTLTPSCYDFLTDPLRHQFNIIDTDSVSSNNYDPHALDLIDRHRSGLVLDCGAGRRPVYYDNVVNFEIVAYDSTDVRGVGEILPFKDGAFDAVLSIAVLEHVKDPFACAREISRVLKPGGRLMCCVPFLQPLHGYPHHYYNMTHTGLGNLFADQLEVEDQLVYDSILPIWSLTWMLRSWAEGLSDATRDAFEQTTVADLLRDPASYLQTPWVRELSAEKNFELASATVLFARKPR